MDHKVANVQQLHDDAMFLYNNLVVGGENSADYILDDDAIIMLDNSMNLISTDSEASFEDIDALDNAIKSEKKVKLKYCRRKLDDKFAASTEQKEFILSPYALAWSNDHYYLVANNEKYDNLMNLRVDRIKKVEILDANIRHFSYVSSYKTGFDIADYVSKTFNMYTGKPEMTELKCKTEILEEMLDRFGEKVSIRKGEDGWFYVHDELFINDGLASWIMQFGDKIQVIYPETLKSIITEKAIAISNMYTGRK